MIRKWQSENTAPLLSLWLESTTEAHPFIEPGYWKENEAMVRDVYLPSAETWVWEQDGEPYGFISVMAVSVCRRAVCRTVMHRERHRARAAEPCSTALPAFNAGGVPEKCPGGEFLPCSGLSH